MSDATSVEIGNVLDTTHVNGPVNAVATAPARGRCSDRPHRRRRRPTRGAPTSRSDWPDKTPGRKHFS